MRRLFTFCAASLLFVASQALASNLVVTEGGTFAASTPVTAFSTPGGSFAYSFDVSSNPTVSGVQVGDFFNPAVSNFVYTLNGVTSTPTVGSVTVYNYPTDGGLFDICFTVPCNNGNILDDGFQLTGMQQIYTGSEASPTIITGSFLPTDAGFYNDGNFTELLAAGPVQITATPEPDSIALLGSGLLLLCGGLRRRWNAEKA